MRLTHSQMMLASEMPSQDEASLISVAVVDNAPWRQSALLQTKMFLQRLGKTHPLVPIYNMLFLLHPVTNLLYYMFALGATL